MDDPFRRSELRRQARIRLGAQRDRVRVLRRRAIVASLLAFVLLWGVVFVQLVSGNDPVLSSKSSKAVASTRSAAKEPALAGETPVERTPAEAETESGLSEEAEGLEIEAAEAEAAELEAAEFEAAEVEAVEAELAATAEEPEAVTTSPS